MTELEKITQLISTWTTQEESFILKNGIPLSQQQHNDALLAGVASPDKIRLLAVKEIPIPQDPEIKKIIQFTRFIGPQTLAITFRYGIYIVESLANDRRVLIHEFTHTAQYERFGSHEKFLTEYVKQIRHFGYRKAPLELEASQTETLI